MNIFINEQEQKLSRERKFIIWMIIYSVIPMLVFIYSKHEYKHSVARIMSLPVEIALPANLPEGGI